MRNDYLQNALKVIDDPNILVNVVSQRVKQLRRGHRALVSSLEKLSAEDTALREIAEGKITYELAAYEGPVSGGPSAWRASVEPLARAGT
jgi:DNA-directed RNA polymerase subunit omega